MDDLEFIPQPPDLPPPLPAGARRRPFHRWAAIFSLWSPFAGFLLVVIGMVALGSRSAEIASVYWSRCGVLFIGLLIALVGCVAALLAFSGARRYGREGIFGRALFGIISNSGLALMLVAGLLLVAKVGYDIRRKGAWAKMTPEEKFNARMNRLDRVEKSLERRADLGAGDGSLAAAASANLLKKLQPLASDYNAKMQSAVRGGFLEHEHLQSRELIRTNIDCIKDFLKADHQIADFYLKYDQIYTDELTKAGVSDAGVKREIAATRKVMGQRYPVVIKLIETNGRWGESQLGALNLLDSSWGAWRFDPVKKKLIFQDGTVAAQYNVYFRDIKAAITDSQTLQKQVEMQDPVN